MKVLKNEDLKLCVIKWGDAWANHGYHDADRDYTPAVMVDIGWLVEENDETIVLCRSYSEDDGQKRNLTVIPWVNVMSYEVLECSND